MYEYIKGVTTAKGEDYIVVETAGFGYRVHVDIQTLVQMEMGKEVKLYLYQQIKEDSRAFYGFIYSYDKSVFDLLTSVPGVGVKLAIRMFDERSAKNIIRLLYNENVAELKTIKGLGEKLIQKTMLELKSKLPDYLLVNDGDEKSGGLMAELREALKGLGYKEIEINRVINEVKLDGKDIETALRDSLSLLSKF